ncbi:PREDICTED: glycerophosphodiester phosphodiesterase 1-like [Branchiostoma belcheri]|uniref:Glycerophosphodiester phosphodiesterase 1-like n=1 Tax=Branchiostoma belcheri TaxID=7741 RepID=A0A6P4YA19_BRABE|nr:PREDICTED: glycerophosphodiester phosphodiesterase 1-like [Branchiostoma belcheri]
MPVRLLVVLGPQVFGVFLVLLAITRNLQTSVLALAFLGACVYHFRIAPVSEKAVEAVLGRSRVVGHRGASRQAPENTIAAIRTAKKNGADSVEFDLEYTKDGVPILLHDDTVDRTTDGTGNIKDLTFAEVQQLDAAAKHPEASKFKGERIPTLEEAVKESLQLGMVMYIDVKRLPDNSAETLHTLFQKYPGLYQSAVVVSFLPEVIYKIRSEDPAIVTALTWRPRVISYVSVDGEPRYTQTWKHVMHSVLDVVFEYVLHYWLWYIEGVSAVNINNHCISREYVKFWADRGCRMLVWTVNDQDEKDFFSNTLGVIYMTDDLPPQS